MHPILISRANLALYLLIWVPIGAIFVALMTLTGQVPWAESVLVVLPLTFLLAFLCLSPWYACRFMPLGETQPWKLGLNHVLSAMVAGGLVAAVTRALLAGLDRMIPGMEGRVRPALLLIAVASSLLYGLSIAGHYAALAIQTSREAAVLAREAELKALKAQVNPHFLFNSLNSISALTSISPARAREMCVRLSDFLRISLRLGERESVSFGEELELTRTYLQVEQVRFGSRLRITEHVDARCGACPVPPLLIQPLVENAIKHGIANMVEGGDIVIAAQFDGAAMRFTIENPFDPEAPVVRSNGIGLRNVRDRLQTRYGGKAYFDISIREDRYRVTIGVPCALTRGRETQPLAEAKA